MTDEPIYYNAVAIKALGSYGAIKKAKHGHKTWKDAFEAFQGDEATPQVKPEIAWKELNDLGISLVLATEKEFPSALNEIPHPPFGLYIKGEASTLQANTMNLAVVGTRQATAEGKELSRQFSGEMAAQGATIISGLAFGIDCAAHEGCLNARGTTVAVFAGGLDDIYPISNARTAKKILDSGGALVSEYPIGEPPLAYRFIARNRIISGLARGVIVIEAPTGSGSLATARFAMEQNRDVFVVPGNVSHPNFIGSHELIRQGATLVTTPSDVLEAYGIGKTSLKKNTHAGVSKEETLILKALESISAPVDVDKIVQITRLEPRIVNQTITFLLLKHFIKEVNGGYTI